MKFNPGDPIWARQVPGAWTPAGEFAGTIVASCPFDDYVVEVFGIHAREVAARWGHPAPDSDNWVINAAYLRPRRDDYQQHEPRTTWEDVKQSLRDNLPLQETVDES